MQDYPFRIFMPSPQPEEVETRRLDEWQSLVSDLVLPMRAEASENLKTGQEDGHFFGRLRFGRFGPSTWLEVTGSGQQLHRSPAEVGNSLGEWLFVSTMTHASGWLVTANERKLIEQGETVFVDSAQPFSLSFDQDFSFVSAMLPRKDLLIYQPHAIRAHACRVSEPVGSALHAFLHSLATGHGSMDRRLSVESRRLYDHFVGLMLLAIEPIALSSPRNPPSHSEILISRIQGALLAALSQPEINSQWIAQRFNLSVRQVQRIFKAQNTTVSRWLLEQRLDRCAESLADPEQSSLAIGEIASNWGFSDLSYFSRAFARRHGHRPGRFRALSLTVPLDHADAQRRRERKGALRNKEVLK